MTPSAPEMPNLSACRARSVFRNGPATVAGAFAEALREVDRFDRVVFAIRDGLPGIPVYAAFESLLVRRSGGSGQSRVAGH